MLLTNCAGANAWNINKGTVYPTIQAAIDAASTGDSIEVHSGTYYENVNVNKQLTLEGVDTGAGQPVVDGSASGSAITIRADGCDLRGFAAVNGEFGIRVISSGNSISNNYATGNTRDGIYSEIVSDNTISGNNATGNGRSGIFLLASSSNTVSGNNATDNSQYGIYLWTASNNIISYNTVNSNTLYGICLNSSSSNNTISDNTVSDNTEFGVLLISSSGNTISDNSVTGCSQNGIHLDSSSDDNSLSGNSATGNTGCGISVLRCNSNSLSDNIVTGNSQHGIYVGRSSGNDLSGNIATVNSGSGICVAYSSNNNTLSDNIAKENSNYGIYLKSSSNNNTIDGNNATGNTQHGICLSTSSDNTISGNTATGNTQYGICIISSSGNTVSGNTVTDNSNCGIYLSYSSNNAFSDNTATGNTYFGIYLPSSSDNTFSSNTASNSQYGIYLLSSSNNTFSDNTATDNSDYGIILDSSSNNNTISGNTVTDSTFCGILLWNAGSNTISGNTATGNTPYGIYLHSSSDNAISGNTATRNTYGIYLESSSDNTISNNTATGNTQHGIYLESSSDNTISGNTATGNSGYGLQIQFSSDNTISGNNASNNYWSGFQIHLSSNNSFFGNTAIGNIQYGFSVFSSSDNIISGNTVTGSSVGIGVGSSSPNSNKNNNNTISGNTITDNGCGILIYYSNSNTISGNTVTGNTQQGIRISVTSGNILFLNTLDNVDYNAQSNGNNHWNATTPQTFVYNGRTLTGFLGNIWSDYDGYDCDSDGVGDTSYNISGGSDKDLHPIGGKVPGLEIKKIADRNTAKVGDLINYTIWINNTGNATLTGVQAEDNLTSAVWTIGTLAKGQNYTNTTGYQVSVADLPGPMVNRLWANATNPCGYEINNSSIATVAISYLPQIMVNKSANLTEGTKSTILNFDINVSNTGNTDFASVGLTDILPIGLDYISDDSGLAHGQTGNKYTWNLGSLNTSDSLSFNLTARINGNKYGDLVNTVNATGDTGYGNPVNASATASVLANEANLSVTKSADPTSGSKGSQINFTLTVKNNGNPALSQVFVSDLLPAGLKYDSSDGGANNGQFINWSNVGPLAKGASSTRWLKATIDGSAYGALTNQVNVTGTPNNGEPINASATASVLANEANLSVTKTADPTSGSKGSQINFTLTAKNNGNAALSQVLVSDLLPAGLKYDSSDRGANNGQFINWSNVGPLAKGASSTRWLKATIDGSAYGALTNQVNATGTPDNGETVNASASASVLANEANLSVTNAADPTSGSKGSQINFTITVTNNGSATLSQVFVSDLLPDGLNYDSSDGGANDGQFINWTNVGPLAGGVSRTLWIRTTVDGSAYGALTNQVNVTGTTINGETVNASATASATSSNICLSGHKYLASTGAGLSGWNITAKDSSGNATTTTTDSSGLWQICNISVGSYTVSEESRDGWMQILPKEGSYKVVLDNDSISDLDFYNDHSCNLTIKKTANKPAARRGEDITYKVDLSNPCTWGSFTNVTLWDILPKSVVLVSVSPNPSTSSSYNLTWDVGTLGPGQNFEATIVVRVPIVDINYDSSQAVRGTGFVNVHNDYDTHQGPESVTNCAYAKADLVETISSCASTQIIDPGTELQSRESGSGSYESEEMVRMRTENKSIRSISSVSAVHQPTTFSLPQNRSIDYGTKWTEATRGINTLTGATIDEQYTFANRIDKNRSIELDENGSTMKTEVEVEGVGHIGMLKKESPDSHPKTKPIYESSEDFVGEFKATEMVDEYGSSVQSNKSMTGYGYVSADKRVRDSQRTYESGTGSYRSDEIISTPTNYIAKDISLVHGPTNYNYTPQYNVSQDIKWSEGMWSKSGTLRGGDITSDSRSCVLPVATTTNCNSSESPATYIGERYSSLDYLKKDSVALSLNEMKTNASFSGIADFRAKAAGSSNTDKIDNEESYVGQYSLTRDIRIGGVSRYDRPHITVTKEGRMTTRWFNKTNANVAEYAITITNDGSSSLAPIFVRDIFPPETEYISSSIRPSSLSEGSVNWTLLNLGIGNSVTIDLALNITDYAPANIVNRVMICGMKGDDCISASAYSTLESGAMACCPPDLSVEKTAKLDATDPTRVRYTIVLNNNANSRIACTVTDRLPTGMSLLQSSVEVSSYVEPLIQWVIVDLGPGEVRTIEYDARASTDGRYVNSVQVDATAVDGSGYATVEAAAQIDIGSTGVAPKTTRYGGWQAPDWNMTSPDEGITIELSDQE